MKFSMRALGVGLILTLCQAEAGTLAHKFRITFDDMKTDAAPPEWKSGFLGSSGSPHWFVNSDHSALSAPHVLKQDGNAPYAWIVHSSFQAANGSVEVQFRILSGKEDPEAGVIWHFKDGSNYYYVRANILENNVVFYHMLRGQKELVKSVDVPVATHRWHRFKVDFRGEEISVNYDGKEIISLQDSKIKGPGGVGLFSMADTVVDFDDFAADEK